MKKTIATIIASMCLVSSLCISVSASDIGKFSWTLKRGAESSKSGIIEKDDTLAAGCKIKSLTYTDDETEFVNFRIRDTDANAATDIYSMYGTGQFDMYYRKGYGNKGDNYRLYANYQSGMAHKTNSVSGTWQP